jgi:peptidyl-prolyl cis-trans isomerase C
MRSKVTRLAAQALIVCACTTAAAEEPAAAPKVEPQVLVTIDDFDMTDLHFALFASQTGRNVQDPAQQIGLLNELVNNFMVANSVQGEAMARTPEVAAALEVARARLVAQTLVRSELEKTPIDEEQVVALYQAEYGNVTEPKKEYKARHILLKTEEDAKTVISELDAGADFATLAAERSTGPSKSVGGDLGWFEEDQMVPEFSAATAELADGQYSKTPVKTQFGWHVILREESRDVPAPSLESVRKDLEQQIQQQQVAKLLADIRAQTTIEVHGPEKTE